MATAVLSATTFSQFYYHTHFSATASQSYARSGGLSFPSASVFTLLNSPHQAPCKNHDVCRRFLSRRSLFSSGAKISVSPSLPCLLSCHSCLPVRAQCNRDVSSSSRRHASGLRSNKYEAMFSSTGIVSLSSGTDRDAGVVCKGAAAAVAGIVTLKPFLDKLMLLSTVVYYYVTGVSALPCLPELVPGGKRVTSAAPKVANPTQKFDRRRVKKKPVQQQQQQQQKPRQQDSKEETWLALESKLSRALSQGDSKVEEQQLSNPVLSLEAFARSPRQLLLYTTLHHLRKEVESIVEADQDLSMSQWRELSFGVISRTILPVCQSWVSQDFTVMNHPVDVARGFQVTGHTTAGEGVENFSLTQSQVLESMTEFLKDTQCIGTYVTKTEKAELYADLIFFLRFGSIRTGGCCDYRSFRRFAGKALEDMVVVVAEVVATLFLDSCSSVATLSPQSETWQAFLLPSILSTRSLERFRNEVALNGWLNQNFTSVVAMFEDRFDLWAFERRPVSSADKKPVKSRSTEKVKEEVESPELVLTSLQLPARRSDELKALTGWRYYYSLYLEFSDIVGPILGMLLTRLGEAVSFLLVRLIGRSLGLVYQGIRQSVRWSPK